MKKSTAQKLKEWRRFYRQNGLPDEQIDPLLNYAEVLLKKGVPVIYDLNHLCALLGLKKNYVCSVVFCSKVFYRTFEMKKRSGGTREICVPYHSLKYLQAWIYSEILSKIPINRSAHGFVRKRSILTNAKVHQGQDCLLKIDLKDFFPSIPINWVTQVFKKIGYTNDVAFYLASICCLEGVLPQGAPTSPALSNIIASWMDKRLYKLCVAYNYKYSRYADDIGISGAYISESFISTVTDVIQDCGFTVNNNKTRLYGQQGNKILAGVSLANGDVRIPRNYRRSLEKDLFYIMKYGYDAHVAHNKVRKANYLQSTMGKVDYWLMIEPKNEMALKAKDYLSKIYKERVINCKF